MSTAAKRLTDIDGFRHHRDKDDLDVRHELLQSLSGFKTVESGHGYVQQDHVGRQTRRHLQQRLSAIAGPDHREFRLKQLAHAFQHQRMIINQ